MKKTQKLIPTFIDANAFIQSLKQIDTISLTGEHFVTESLQTLSKHGLSHRTLKYVVDLANGHQDPEVQNWAESQQELMTKNYASMGLGMVLESAGNNAVYDSMMKPYQETLAKMYGQPEEDIRKSVAIDGVLDKALAAPIRNYVGQVKNGYYQENPKETSQVSANCVNPLGCVETVADGMLMYFDRMLFLVQGNQVRPIPLSVAMNKYKLGRDFENLCKSLDNLCDAYQHNKNCFDLSLSIGNVTANASEEGFSLSMNGRNTDMTQIAKEHNSYSKLHKSNIHLYKQLQEDDQQLMQLKYLMSRNDKLAILDNIYKCKTSGRLTEYLMCFKGAYYVAKVYADMTNQGFQFMKYNMMADAVQKLAAPNFGSYIKKEYANAMADENAAMQTKTATLAVYQEHAGKLDAVIAELENSVRKLSSKPFQATNVENLTSQIASLKANKIELLQRMQEIEAGNQGVSTDFVNESVADGDTTVLQDTLAEVVQRFAIEVQQIEADQVPISIAKRKNAFAKMKLDFNVEEIMANFSIFADKMAGLSKLQLDAAELMPSALNETLGDFLKTKLPEEATA